MPSGAFAIVVNDLDQRENKVHPNFGVEGRPESVERWDGLLLEQRRRDQAGLLKQPHARSILLCYLETRFSLCFFI